MANCGDGYRIHITGLTHDERGYPGMDEKTQAQMVNRLIGKIVNNRDKIIRTENVYLDDADVVVVAYGISARSARQAVRDARARGIRAGLIKLETVWPFPEALIRDVAGRVRALIMPEINAGQMVLELQRCAGGACPVHLVAHMGGSIIHPATILSAIEDSIKGKK
jgi:2-oxoglutarate ferredoxin oxidoreductase subunit alpha